MKRLSSHVRNQPLRMQLATSVTLAYSYARACTGAEIALLDPFSLFARDHQRDPKVRAVQARVALLAASI